MIIKNGQVIAIDAVSAGHGLRGDGRPNNPIRLDDKITGLTKVNHDNTLKGDGTEDNKLKVNLDAVKDDRIYGYGKDGKLHPVESNNYTAGQYIKIDNDVISVTGLQPAGNYVTSSKFNSYSAQQQKELNNKLNTTAFSTVSGDFAKKTDIPSLNGYATTAWVTKQGYAKKTDIPTKVSQLQNDVPYLSAHQSLTAYATKTDLTNATKNKLDTTAFSTVSGDFALKSEIPELISGASKEWVISQGYATSSYVDKSVSSKLDTTAFSTVSGTFLTAHQSLDGYALSADVAADLENKLDTTAFSTVSSTFLTAHQSLDGYVTSADLEDKLDTTAFSTVSGTFLTAHQSLEGYVTTADLEDKLDTTAFSTVSGTFLTAHQSLTAYAKIEDIPDVQDFATTDYVDLAISSKLDITAFNTYSSSIDTTINGLKATDDKLQEQIDAIHAASDVKDVVSDHKALDEYDTTTLGNNDIVKVLKDETKEYATVYYRWVISETTDEGEWVFIGSIGPYRTVAEQSTIDDYLSGAITGLDNTKLDRTEFSEVSSTFLTTADLAGYALSADVEAELADKLDTEEFNTYSAGVEIYINEGHAASAWIDEFSADLATKEYVDDIANELSAAISAIEPEFELSAAGFAGIVSQYDPETHTIYTELTGISGTSGVSVKFDEDNDCWIISADKDQITDTYFAGEYQSLNGISTDTTFTYNATASSSNITVLDDGVIIIKNQTNTSTPTKLTFNINEAINGEIDYPGWLLNSIALYQGKLPDEAIIENEDGTITIDTDNYGEDGWTIEWHNTPIWQCGDYYAAECGLSELTFGYTVENGTKTCCYKVVYKGDETNQGDDDTASVISKISIVAAAESLNSGSSTPEIIEIESRLDNIEDTLNSKLLNTLSISSVDDISYLQNNQTTVHLTLFKPDMNFTLSNSTKIKCYIDRIDYIPDTNALCSFVLYKLADDGISAKLIAISNELSDELRTVKSQNKKDLTFTLQWIDPEETELSSNTMYYAGFFFNFGAILMGGNTINWSLSNFSPYLTFIRDNMTQVTSYDDIREYFTNLQINNTDGGRVSTYRVFFELNNKGLGN